MFTSHHLESVRLEKFGSHSIVVDSSTQKKPTFLSSIQLLLIIDLYFLFVAIAKSVPTESITLGFIAVSITISLYVMIDMGFPGFLAKHIHLSCMILHWTWPEVSLE